MKRTSKAGESEAGVSLRKLVLAQSSDDLLLSDILYGPRIAAEEYVLRYKAACKRDGHKYVREEAISKAAKHVGLDVDKLTNWLNRSKQVRGR